MTNEDYYKTLQAIGFISGYVSSLDLDGFIARINKTESVAPVLDPTLYLKGMENLQEQKELAQLLKGFQDKARIAVARAEKHLGVKVMDDGTIQDIGEQQ